MLSLIDTINEWMEPVKGWLDSNHGNPILWIALFVIGVLIFFITFSALSKNN